MNNSTSRNAILGIGKIRIADIQVSSDLMIHKVKSGLKVLTENIMANGLLVPLTVGMLGGKFILIDGFKRLEVWKKLYPDKPIPCTILDYCQITTVDDMNLCGQQFYDKFSINLARSKVPTKQIEKFVVKLHDAGMGYEAIARCIGYKKSGVQGIIRRMKEKEFETAEANADKKKLLSQIKRVKALWNKLTDQLNAQQENYVPLLQQVNDFLMMHEELIESDLQAIPTDEAK